ncbi:hypothetical protein JRC42_24675 (plasmid) [Escherichia albertii]|uniref:hypothetical protein n=1 Tax=Escherichia albertii TaxID=208962 RepID=UPI00195F00E6|nr:hypothetical protein [Escherichia albertii]QST30887.1 hypothetical protein JRC42_24675 [Escherichia albertii]QST40200.1 hypothetical protein JRC46_24525 [Escherichia albertii]
MGVRLIIILFLINIKSACAATTILTSGRYVEGDFILFGQVTPRNNVHSKGLVVDLLSDAKGGENVVLTMKDLCSVSSNGKVSMDYFGSRGAKVRFNGVDGGDITQNAHFGCLGGIFLPPESTIYALVDGGVHPKSEEKIEVRFIINGKKVTLNESGQYVLGRAADFGTPSADGEHELRYPDKIMLSAGKTESLLKYKCRAGDCHGMYISVEGVGFSPSDIAISKGTESIVVGRDYNMIPGQELKVTNKLMTIGRKDGYINITSTVF